MNPKSDKTRRLVGGCGRLILDMQLKTRAEAGCLVVPFHRRSEYQAPCTGELWESPADGCASDAIKV